MSRFYTSSYPTGLRVRTFGGLLAADLQQDVNDFLTAYTSQDNPKLRSIAAAGYFSASAGGGGKYLSLLKPFQSLHQPLSFWAQAISKSLSSVGSPVWQLSMTIVDDGSIAQAGDVVITTANPRCSLREVASTSNVAIENAFAACETELESMFNQAIIFETIFVAGPNKHLVGLFAQEE